MLRVLYRNTDTVMLLTLPVGQGGAPPPTCSTPLLIDPLTGAARAISREEAALRLKTMEMSGATQGTCPAGQSKTRPVNP